MKHDSNIAARFATFRKTHIAKSQVEAGKKLGVSQSKISDIESCQLAPDFNLIKKMTVDYHLNFEWLATGRGELVLNKNEEGREVNNSSITNSILVELDTLKKLLSMNQMNFNYLLKAIDKLDKRIERLENVPPKNKKIPA